MLVSLKIGQYRTQFQAIAVIVVLLGVTLLANLGFWQLDRAEQKRAILADIEARQTAEPLSLNELMLKDDKAYYQLSLTGEFLPEPVFLLDNRFYNSRPGFEVLQVFNSADKHILVNRGWIPFPRDRSQLPDVPVTEQTLNITGEVNYPSEAIVLRADDLSKISRFPALIQSIDLTALQNYLASKELTIEPWVLRQKGQDGFYSRQWINVNMPPERHISYAVTWFGLAIALIIIYIAAATTKEEQTVG